MRPLTVITGIVLGSSASIALGLMVVLLIFLILGIDEPRRAAEFHPLLASVSIFLGMTTVAALSFYSLLKNRRWSGLCQLLMWFGILLVARYYWPK